MANNSLKLIILFIILTLHSSTLFALETKNAQGRNGIQIQIDDLQNKTSTIEKANEQNSRHILDYGTKLQSLENDTSANKRSISETQTLHKNDTRDIFARFLSITQISITLFGVVIAIIALLLTVGIVYYLRSASNLSCQANKYQDMVNNLEAISGRQKFLELTHRHLIVINYHIAPKFENSTKFNETILKIKMAYDYFLTKDKCDFGVQIISDYKEYFPQSIIDEIAQELKDCLSSESLRKLLTLPSKNEEATA